MTPKRCNRCRQNKPRDQFSKGRGNPDGLQYACKLCKRQQAVEWEQRNPGRKNELAHLRHQRRPVEHREELQRWRKANPDKARAQYRKAAGKRRALEAQVFIEDVDARIVYIMHGGMCGICKQFVSQGKFEIDHVIPIARGGQHGYINVQPAHPFCNRSKRDRLQSEMTVENEIVDQIHQ